LHIGSKITQAKVGEQIQRGPLPGFLAPDRSHSSLADCDAEESFPITALR
jgi:hypothetical protein